MTTLYKPLPRRRRPREEARPVLELPLDPPRPIEREVVRPEKGDEGERGSSYIDFYI